MTHTDKQPQTVYVESYDGEYFTSKASANNPLPVRTTKHENVIIHTPEELQALKAEWQREQWISVNDKSTPDYDGKYLCFIEHPQECGNVWMYQEVVECLVNKWMLKDNQKVTHWIPLPQPPKP